MNNHLKTSIYLSLLLAVFLILPKISHAADFYVDPVSGSMSNDGSQAHPWSTMQAVWDNGKINTRKYGNGPNPTPPYTYIAVNPSGPVHAGDTIYLLSGYHGDLVIIGALNTDFITVKAATGANPTFRHIDLLAASKWIFDGISVSPSYDLTHLASAVFEAPQNDYQGPSSDITLKNSEVFSIPDITGITQEYWMANATRGVFFSHAPNCIIDNVKIYNVTSGVQINASPYCELKNSEIKNVMGDGVGISQADYLKIEYNVIKNIFDPPAVLGLHTDLIQFSSDGIMANAMTGVEVRGNTVMVHEDENQQFVGPTQGISGFDGFFKYFVIENNLVMVGMYHGISLYGTINSRIVNNTCVIPRDNDIY